MNSKKKVKIMLVTRSSEMFLCCTNLAWNTWINGLVYFTNLNATVANNQVGKCWTMSGIFAAEKCSIDEAKLFDQHHSLCKFIEKQLGTNALAYCKMMAHERWAAYFNMCSIIELFSKLLKIAQFYFSIIAHNANVERIFSLMKPQ